MSSRDPSPHDRSARIPIATPGCDLRALPLSSTEAYVFSRVDGQMTEADLIVCTGLDALTVTVALDRLSTFGALRFGGGAPKRTASQMQPRVTAAPTRGTAPPADATRFRSDVVVRSGTTPSGPSAARASTSTSQTQLGAAHSQVSSLPAALNSRAPGSVTSPPRATPLPTTYRPPSARPDRLRDVQRYLEAARLALQEGNPRAAANFYRLAQQLAPEDRAIRAAIDQCAAESSAAVSVTEQASVLVRQGDAAARERRWDDAARDYEQASMLVPKDPVVLYKVSGALLRCGRLPRATEFAERSAELEPQRLDTWLLLAQIHLEASNVGEARMAIARAQRLSPADERIARLRAKLPT